MTDSVPTPAPARRMLPIAPGGIVARRIWQMLRGRRLALTGVVLLFIVESATALVFPLVIGTLVTTVLEGASSGTGTGTGASIPASFWGQLALLAAAALVSGAVAWAGSIALARLAETLIAELREDYVAAALDLPRAVVEEAGTGDVVTRASDDIAQISDALPDVLPRLAVSVFTIVLVAATLGTLNPWYLAGFALTVPMYAGTVWWYLRTAPPIYTAERAADSARGQHILGTLTQLPTVTAHRLEERQLGRIRQSTWETVRWAMRARIVQNRLFGRLNAIEAIGLLAVLGVGVWLAFAGTSRPGEVTAAALLFLRTVAPIEALLFVMDELQSALAALGRVVGVIDASARTPVPQADPADLATATPATATTLVAAPTTLVTAEDLSFSYRENTPVLAELNLSLRRGETVAVVGATGSGKSTLAALIAGIHAPSAGRISRSIPLSGIVTVAQETHVFAGTLRDNLALADSDYDDAALADALSQVQASDLLNLLPGGLDAEVGDGGHQLTAAEAQHLALARVVLAAPALVILDEATAESDSSDADALDRAASATTQGRAAVVIAHRLSQAAACDRIIVMAEGRIVESGTHPELLTAGGTYARLWSAWSGGGTEFEKDAQSGRRTDTV